MMESFFWFFLEWAFGKDVPVCDGMKKDGMGGCVFLGDVVVLLRIVLVPFHVVPGKEIYAHCVYFNIGWRLLDWLERRKDLSRLENGKEKIIEK